MAHFAHRLDGSRRVRLDKFDPADTQGTEKDEGVERVETLGRELSELENLLAYAGTHALLVVLQGRDASGKDGSIRKILEFTNVQQAYVQPFKVPTEDEQAHDFLWRVHKLVPEAVWKGRFDHINAFERLILDADVILLKFYLHVSADEQYKRLRAREKDPRTAWKLNPGDWRELPLWDDFTEAYEDVLNRCATRDAPWYLVPADKKWFRNLAVMDRIVRTLRPYRKVWLDTLKAMGKTAMKEIRELRAQANKRR